MNEKDFYHLVKKVKMSDRIQLEDGTEFWIEEKISESWFKVHIKLPEGKKYEFIKSDRKESDS